MFNSRHTGLSRIWKPRPILETAILVVFVIPMLMFGNLIALHYFEWVGVNLVIAGFAFLPLGLGIGAIYWLDRLRVLAEWLLSLVGV